MANEATEKNTNNDVSEQKKLDDLWELVDSIETCMLTTRLPDGSLVSRPMSNVRREPDGRIWFMTSLETHKVEEIEAEPHVNLAYYADREWVSVCGTALVVTDRAKIHELYEATWRAWLPDEGGARDGSADDPRIALLEVTPVSIHYFVKSTTKAGAMVRMAASIVTGRAPKLGETRHVDAADLAGR